MGDSEFKKHLFKTLREAPCAIVQARIIAHRYCIPWQQVEGLAEDLLIQKSRLVEQLADVCDGADLIALREIADDDTFIREFFSHCGSPIEQLFLAYLADDCFCWNTYCGFPNGGDHIGSCEVSRVYQQHQVSGFKLDFAFARDGQTPGVAIELDGHDFHERTKQQAQKDKSRDRKLQEAGWSVLRFTGSEVWRDPEKVVGEARSIAGKLLGQTAELVQ